MVTLRDQVLDFLREHGGAVSDEDGRVTPKIAEELDCSKQYLSTLIKDMEDEGVIHRDTRGKRTYFIALPDNDTEPVPVDEVVTEPESAPEPPTSTAVVYEPLDYSELAASLLRLVVDRAGQPDIPDDKLELWREVKVLRRENTSKREQIATLAEQKAQLEEEVGDLKSKVAALERNLEVERRRTEVRAEEFMARIGDQIDGRTKAQIKRMMQEVPVG